MALTAKLVFENNQAPESNSSAKKYLLKDFSVRVGRSHNDERPDGGPLCDSLELTFIAPDESDLTVKIEGTTVTVNFNTDKIPVEHMLNYTLGKTHVKDVNLKDADIEEIIRRLYKGEVIEGENKE